MSKKGKLRSKENLMARTYRTVSRFFAIINLLERCPHGMTVRDVWNRLEKDHPADERTYRRDLQNLEYMGYLTTFDDATTDAIGLRYAAIRSPKIGKALNLELRELFALYVAQNMLTPLRDTPFYEELQQVFTKIETILGDKCREHLATLSSEVHFEPGPRWGLGLNSEVLDVVERCCAEGHTLNARYDSVNSGEERERALGPHFLYFAKGSLYLVAEDLEDNVIKVFSLPRMSKASMSEDAYSGQKVDPEKYFDSAFGVWAGETKELIELIFYPPYAAPVRERRWHSSQKIIPCSDGTVRMSLEVAITPELIQWIMGFGEGVYIEKPKSLVNDVVNAAEALIALYKPKKVA